MTYTCPVCGYELNEPAADHNICPSCGTEFEYDDIGHTVEELRQAWIVRGTPWFSKHTLPPPDWNPAAQLARVTITQYVSFIYTGQNVTATVQYSGAPASFDKLPTNIVENQEPVQSILLAFPIVPSRDSRATKPSGA